MHELALTIHAHFGNDSWRATCTCGHGTKWVGTETEAVMLHDDHKIAANNAASSEVSAT